MIIHANDISYIYYIIDMKIELDLIRWFYYHIFPSFQLDSLLFYLDIWIKNIIIIGK